MYGLDFRKGMVGIIEARLDKTLMKFSFAWLDMPFAWLKFLLFMQKHNWNYKGMARQNVALLEFVL